MVDNFEARQVRAAPGAAGAAAAAAGAGLLPEEDEDDSALSKFSKDIVQMARDGKLDPVVGRDEEISRVVSSPSLSFPLSLSLFKLVETSRVVSPPCLSLPLSLPYYVR